LPAPPEAALGDSVRHIAPGRNGFAGFRFARAMQKNIRIKLLKFHISRSEEQAITGGIR
jgi:hypothetical protein